MDKKQKLLELAKRRQQTDPPAGSFPIGKYHEGIYECDYVSPWTKGAHNVEANIFLLLQDWGSDDELSAPIDLEKHRVEMESGRTQDQRTNKNLMALLDKHFNHLQISDTYGTNLFPYIKAGPKDATISKKDLEWAAKEFALPQIKVVNPKLVICFGKAAFNAVRVEAGEKEVGTVEEGINSPFFFNGSKVWLQSHPGCWGAWNRNKGKGDVDQVGADWAKMAEYICALP